MKSENGSPYHSLIRTATGVDGKLLSILEELMRDEVFHSTLDWQSAPELAEGARKALQIYRGNTEFFALQHQLDEARGDLDRAQDLYYQDTAHRPPEIASRAQSNLLEKTDAFQASRDAFLAFEMKWTAP